MSEIVIEKIDEIKQNDNDVKITEKQKKKQEYNRRYREKHPDKMRDLARNHYRTKKEAENLALFERLKEKLTDHEIIFLMSKCKTYNKKPINDNNVVLM